MDIYLNEPDKILYRIALAIFKARKDIFNNIKDKSDVFAYIFKNLIKDNDMQP